MCKILSIATIFSVLFLSGFAQDKKLYAQQDNYLGNKIKCPEPKDETLRLKPGRISSKDDLVKILCFYSEAMSKNPQEVETARRIRDGIVNYIEGLIDENYNKYADELYKNRNRQSIPSSVLNYVTGIDTATKPDSIADSDCAKKTASACFLSSITSDLANKKPSKELSVEILLLAMEISRTQIAAEIKEKMKLDVNTYPLEIARRDLRNYFFAGTPIGAARGLGEILKQMKK